jgi:hypothetical protein
MSQGLFCEEEVEIGQGARCMRNIRDIIILVLSSLLQPYRGVKTAYNRDRSSVVIFPEQISSLSVLLRLSIYCGSFFINSSRQPKGVSELPADRAAIESV